MLVLTRKWQESIMIGDDVEVTVVEVGRNGCVRLGIEAPKHIPVHRKEVYEAIQKEMLSPPDRDTPKS